MVRQKSLDFIWLISTGSKSYAKFISLITTKCTPIVYRHTDVHWSQKGNVQPSYLKNTWAWEIKFGQGSFFLAVFVNLIVFLCPGLEYWVWLCHFYVTIGLAGVWLTDILEAQRSLLKGKKISIDVAIKDIGNCTNPRASPTCMAGLICHPGLGTCDKISRLWQGFFKTGKR